MKVYLPPLRRPRIEMVPLIDSFFLLLAFFMSSILSMEAVRGLPIDLPKAGSSAKVSQENRLVITLGKGRALQWEGQPVNLELLQERLSRSPNKQKLQVGIRADRETSYEWLVQVLFVVRQTGVGRVTLMVASDVPKG